MLRISTHRATGESVMLRLDGQITGQWVKLLQKTCDDHLKDGRRIIIDLENVSFADRDGVALLRTLADQVEFLNALPFIAEQIRTAGP